MKIKITLFLLFCFLSFSTYADQAHISKQFEETLSSCLPGGNKEENCLVESILKFTVNEEYRDQLPSVIGGLINSIIGSGEVFAVHPVQGKVLGDFIVEDSYIIEIDSGIIALLQVSFMKLLGTWEVRNVGLSTVNEKIDAKLGVNI